MQMISLRAPIYLPSYYVAVAAADELLQFRFRLSNCESYECYLQN